MNTSKGAVISVPKGQVLSMKHLSSYKMLKSPLMSSTSNWMMKNSQAWMMPGDTPDVPGDWSLTHQAKKDLPNLKEWMQPSRLSPCTELKLNKPMWNITNWYTYLSCDDDWPATTFEPGQLYPGYCNDWKGHQTPPVAEQTCSQILDQDSPERKSVNCHELVSGPECSNKTIHGKWLSETTRPSERSSEIELLKNFHQYWLGRDGKEVKDPLRKTLQAL
jgi:hypothetical protein